MGNTCVSVVSWLWRHPINWEALSAIGTFLAAGLAVYLPQSMARKEWARQDRIRTEEQARIAEAKNDVIHEVCSTVDRILAYRKAAIALFEGDNVYHVGFAAFARIHENTKTLFEMLEQLKGRSELTDGALYVALMGMRLAESIVLQAKGGSDPSVGQFWINRANALKALDPLADMVEARNLKVRKTAGLNEKSESAQLILKKYEPLAAAIKASRQADSGAPDIEITKEYY